MEQSDNNYGENPVDDMMTDYDYHINTGELPELFDERSIDDFIANLNDWWKSRCRLTPFGRKKLTPSSK